MLQILTPLSKGTRVSRKVDASTFVASPGIWGAIASDGSIANVVTATPALVNKMVISNASSNVYESHDITVGRITTLETPGIRCQVDTDGYVDSASVAVGADLVVSCDAGDEGKLAVEADVANGTYEVVARVEEFDATNNLLTFVTVSPRTITFS
jgi:hypothetical protein